MALSLAVAARSHRLKEAMLDFMSRLYVPWSTLTEEDRPDCFSGPLADPSKPLVGFNYEPTSGPEREYHFAIARWMALQIGKRRSKFRFDGLNFTSPVPYVVFDGIELCPVLLQVEWPSTVNGKRRYLVDGLGMRMDEAYVNELAWHCVPEEAYSIVSVTHHGQTPEAISDALIQAGVPGTQETLQAIRTQLAKLDVLWREAQRTSSA